MIDIFQSAKQQVSKQTKDREGVSGKSGFTCDSIFDLQNSPNIVCLWLKELMTVNERYALQGTILAAFRSC